MIKFQPFRWVDCGRVSPDVIDQLVRGVRVSLIPVGGNGTLVIGEVYPKFPSVKDLFWWEPKKSVGGD